MSITDAVWLLPALAGAALGLRMRSRHSLSLGPGTAEALGVR